MQFSRSVGVSNDEPDSAVLPSASRETGLILAYPDRAYADHRGLTLLGQLRQHLSEADYCEALPAQIMDCCHEIRRRASSGDMARLEMTGSFDVGNLLMRFRAVSLPLKRPSAGMPVLVMLYLVRHDGISGTDLA